VPDARWALDQVREEYGAVPVVLLGHSMGARTAARVADDRSVVGLVALAPWFPADDPADGVAGKPLVAIHGNLDRVTSARETRDYVDRLGDRARFVDMGQAGHYMLRRRKQWNRATVSSILDMLP